MAEVGTGSFSTPDKFILDVAMSVSSDSSDILKRFRELVAKKSDEKRQLLGQTSLPDDRLKHATNLNQEFNSEETQKDSAVIIFSDPECSKAETTPNKSSRKASSVLRPKSTNVIHKRRTGTQKEKEIHARDETTSIQSSEKSQSITKTLERKVAERLPEKEQISDTCDCISINGRSYLLDVPLPWPLLRKSTSAKIADRSFESDQLTSDLMIHHTDSSSSQHIGKVETTLTPRTSYGQLPENDSKALYDPLPISPFTKATAMVPSSDSYEALKDGAKLTQSETVALIEKNKTLMKEVRFAEQTCVEVGEKHAAIERELLRLQTESQQLKEENRSLNIQLHQANIASAKLEEGSTILMSKISEQQLEYDRNVQRLDESIHAQQKTEKCLRNENIALQKRNIELTLEYAKLQEEHNLVLSNIAENDIKHHREVEILQEKLDEVRCLGESFMEGLEESNRAKVSLEMELVAERARHETLVSEFNETKATMNRLIHRSDYDASAINSNKNVETEALKNALIDLQVKYDKKCEEMDIIHEKTKNEKNEVQLIDRSIPHSHASPTRKILAETLRNVLERDHVNVSRLIELERMNTRVRYESEKYHGNEFPHSFNTLENTLIPTSNLDQGDPVQHLSIETQCFTSFTTTPQILTPCAQCETLTKNLASARIRIQELEDSLEILTSLKTRENESIKQKLQETFQSLIQVADSIEGDCNQKLDLYSEKLNRMSNFLRSFQNVCTFVDDYDDGDDEAVDPCVDETDLREQMRTKIASLRSQVQIIEESLGHTEDDIETVFGEHPEILIDEVAIQNVNCTQRKDKGIGVSSGGDIAVDQDVSKTSNRADDGRITVVVNLYTK